MVELQLRKEKQWIKMAVSDEDGMISWRRLCCDRSVTACLEKLKGLDKDK